MVKNRLIEERRIGKDLRGRGPHLHGIIVASAHKMWNITKTSTGNTGSSLRCEPGTFQTSQEY